MGKTDGARAGFFRRLWVKLFGLPSQRELTANELNQVMRRVRAEYVRGAFGADSGFVSDSELFMDGRRDEDMTSEDQAKSDRIVEMIDAAGNGEEVPLVSLSETKFAGEDQDAGTKTVLADVQGQGSGAHGELTGDDRAKMNHMVREVRAGRVGAPLSEAKFAKEPEESQP